MLSSHQISNTAGNAWEEEGADDSGSLRDQDLIHSPHPWLSLVREAASTGHVWPSSLGQVLQLLRKLLGARVGVVKAYSPEETFSLICSESRASEAQLSANVHFNRLCEHLFSATESLRVDDALDGKEFVDPLLKLTLPHLSLLTTSWTMPGVVVLFAFFSQEIGHFNADHELILNYFGSPVLVGSSLDSNEISLYATQIG